MQILDDDITKVRAGAMGSKLYVNPDEVERGCKKIQDSLQHLVTTTNNFLKKVEELGESKTWGEDTPGAIAEGFYVRAHRGADSNFEVFSKRINAVQDQTNVAIRSISDLDTGF